MRRPRGVPADLDAKSAAQVERTFRIVRVVRSTLLLVFLVLAAMGVEAKGWPHGITVGLVLLAAVLTARLAVDVRHLAAGHG